MKWRVALLIIVVLAAFLPTSTFADVPQPWAYAAVQCSGLPVSQVWSGFYEFSAWYGWAHQVKTPTQWSGSYDARVNEYAHLLGCGDMLENGALSRWAKSYVPVYTAILTSAPWPE